MRPCFSEVHNFRAILWASFRGLQEDEAMYKVRKETASLNLGYGIPQLDFMSHRG